MKTLIIIGLFVLFLVSVQFASAQTVDEVIDKYILARGGKEKLNAIKTIYMEGSREMMGNEVMVKIIKEQGRLSRTEFEMGTATGFNLITEKEAWNFFPMRSQEPQQLADSLLPAMQTELDIAGPLVDYTAKGHTAELIGKESIDDITCYKIILTIKTGKKISYWIRTDNYLLLQSTPQGGMMMGRRRNNPESGAPAPGNAPKGGKAFVIYSDYKNVDGILFPHSIQIKTEGTEMQGGGTTFDKIELNKPIDEKYYLPK